MTYLEKVSTALNGVYGEDWNNIFLSNLRDQGLCLAPDVDYEDLHLYPNNYPILAPRPYGDESLWPKHTVMVYISSP